MSWSDQDNEIFFKKSLLDNNDDDDGVLNATHTITVSHLHVYTLRRHSGINCKPPVLWLLMLY